MLKGVLVASALGMGALTFWAVQTPSSALPGANLAGVSLAPPSPAVTLVRGRRGGHFRVRGFRHIRGWRHFRGRRFYGVYAGYGGGCAWLRHRALVTGSAYWWRRYRLCRGW
jgi:hypothetical protein